MKEKTELERLREENAQLKRAMKDQTVEYWCEHAMVTVLCEQYGLTREELKKNIGRPSSKQPAMKPR